MVGENRLIELVRSMQPRLNKGEYVFVLQPANTLIPAEHLIGLFQEKEGTTLILKKKDADALGLHYEFVSAWITLDVHSSLAAVGLTTAVSNALSKNSISCNVIAAYYHDHIFVAVNDGRRALQVLLELSKNFKAN